MPTGAGCITTTHPEPVEGSPISVDGLGGAPDLTSPAHWGGDTCLLLGIATGWRRRGVL